MPDGEHNRRVETVASGLQAAPVPVGRERARTPRIWVLSAVILAAGLALFAVTDGPPAAPPAWSSWSG